MTECNAIIEANNEIDKLKRENKILNALCVEYGFEMGRLEEENEQLKKQLESKEKAHTRCDELYWKLYDENEQLKEEINDLNEVLVRYEEKELENDRK